jgi:hydroxyacylglutathione hydrolase
MKQLAEGVWQLSGFPADNMNKYLVGDVLIDSGTRLDQGRVLRDLQGRDVAAHALTHAHFDHYGSSHAVCEQRGIPLWCGAADAEAVEAGKMVARGGRLVPAAKAHPVARHLGEGDEVAGFVVLDTPGHSPGHVSFWRESDRTLICGDVFWGYNPFLMRGGPRRPPKLVNPDDALNQASARRLAELRPALTCFGHGPPVRDASVLAAAAG